ncbi:MAG: Na+/H+ antiporter NhaA [bacterium]
MILWHRRALTKSTQLANNVLRPFQEFFRIESSAGILLFICTAVALFWANSPWSTTYSSFWQYSPAVDLGRFKFSKSLEHLVNDGLMAIFFLVVGLEIKRELLVGEISSLKKAALPVIAAIGGMLVPASLFLSFNSGTEGSHGWGIPMATDIAFAIGVLSLLGNRIPLGLKVFLTALAIIDDLGAVLVIAFFYTSEINGSALIVAGMIFLLLLLLNYRGIRLISIYVVLGFFLWIALLKSGVHATIAGVLLAATIPAQFNRSLDQEGEGTSPLQKLEHTLHPWVSYFIMPVFALANAGIVVSAGFLSALTHSISAGIILGLVIGKQVGITLFAWLAVRLKLASLPAHTRWIQLYGVGWLGGIGFTMSLFIATLAYGESEILANAKLAILMGSVIAGFGGWALLRSVRS